MNNNNIKFIKKTIINVKITCQKNCTTNYHFFEKKHDKKTLFF